MAKQQPWAGTQAPLVEAATVFPHLPELHVCFPAMEDAPSPPVQLREPMSEEAIEEWLAELAASYRAMRKKLMVSPETWRRCLVSRWKERGGRRRAAAAASAAQRCMQARLAPPDCAVPLVVQSCSCWL